MSNDNKKNPESILIVDDLEVNVGILENIIRSEGYEPLCALNVKEALELMNDTMPQLILSDYYMPDMNGVEFCQLLKKNPKTRDIPFVLITVSDANEVKKAAFDAGAVDYIAKPFERTEVVMRVNNQMNSYRAKWQIAEHNRRMHRVIEEQKALMEKEQENLLLALSKIVEKRSREMGQHQERVGHNCRILAQSLYLAEQFEDEINDAFVETISTAAKLHDIGALVIPDEMVAEGGRRRMSDDTEYVRMHTKEGAALLEEICAKSTMSRFLDMAVSIARYHHNHWDGTGYPGTVEGREIPLAARIVCVVNDFDAEFCRQEDKETALDDAMQRICDRGGEAYDPEIVRIFSKIKKQLKIPAGS